MKRLSSVSAMVLLCAAIHCEGPIFIRVAAAANLSGTFELLARAFEAKRPDSRVEVVFASSGALAAQIRAYAPYDLFLSADTANTRKLEAEGFAQGKSRVYAYGVLCVASRLGVEASLSLSFLADRKYRSIAIAQPELAPYGLAARQALVASGLWDPLSDRLVYATNIGQVNQFVTSSSCDAGFVNLSAVLTDPAYAAPGRPGIAWARVPSSLYEPIAQAGILLKHASAASARSREGIASAFFDFILSSEGRFILEKAGYEGPS
jgi:molybdate transport system substrate-binding protein